MRLSHALRLLALVLLMTSLAAQMPPELMKTLDWRCIGPFRGGRSCTATGIPGDRDTYYFGGAGGGVWKTTDAGKSWKNVSDGSFGGSIGTVAVSTNNSRIVWAGEGEQTVRGNVSSGHGIWKSTNGGKSWKHMGLKESRHICRIRIHPDNPDIVYVAALGHLSGPNKERGVFKTIDGGVTWTKVLFANDAAGAVDLCMDPSDPDTLYASTWRVTRTPWSLESGGEGSALWKSTNAGQTWENLSESDGFPEGTLGIIGVAVSPARTERVWAMVENKNGGLFRSENGGKTWRRVNNERKLRQRAWYYTRVYADSKDIDRVYVMNVQFHRSDDGGKTFSSIRVPHSDNHDLWIDPEDPQRLINANDGGANVSFDGGKTWSKQDNQPTAQFYRVTTDNSVPYRVLGAQQDNSTVRIKAWSPRGRITDRDWEPSAGGESGHMAPHPQNPDIVYGGSYGGTLTRVDHRTGNRRSVNVWPNSPIGWGAGKLRYRFNWNFPLFFSPHDSNVLYAAGNVLFKSTNEGQSWEPISPDLTRNDKTRQGPSGGPITKDNTTVEYYCTIFAAIESPHEAGVLWCASDDGMIHLSRDGGKNWGNVTPKGLPEWMQFNSIEAHPTEKGGLYVAGTRYKIDDFTPYLYRTLDYGKTWKCISEGNGIDPLHFTRVIRADPKRKGLLYAGTERGAYVSFDDGERWQPLQLNLPISPITDMAIKDDDLIAATQGRSFWILDNLDHLRQLQPAMAQAAVTLFTPEPTVRGLRGGGASGSNGANPPAGLQVRFFLKDKPDPKQTVKLEVLDPKNQVVKIFSTTAKKAASNDSDSQQGRQRGGSSSKEQRIKVKQGMNKVSWNLRYEGATRVPGMVLWGAYLGGPTALTGEYRVRLTVGSEERSAQARIVKHPLSPGTEEDMALQFVFVLQNRDKLTEVHEAIVELRDVRKQIEAVTRRLDHNKHKHVVEVGSKISKGLTSVEEALHQTKAKSSQDVLNYPIRLNNKLGSLSSMMSRGDHRPTDQAMTVQKELFRLIDAQLDKLRGLMERDLPAFNKLLTEKSVPYISPKEKSGTATEKDDK